MILKDKAISNLMRDKLGRKTHNLKVGGYAAVPTLAPSNIEYASGEGSSKANMLP